MESKNIKDVTLNDLRDFVVFIHETGLGAYSQARVISGIKAFFKFLILEKEIVADPSELLESPKLGRKLPEVLTQNEISKMIDTIDLSKPEGERDKAILETLYGCGMRVSELINLKISDLRFKEGILSVTGKGNKQRLVPIGLSAQKQINIYKDQVRIHAVPEKQSENILFLNRRGKKLSRQMIRLALKRILVRILLGIPLQHTLFKMVLI